MNLVRAWALGIAAVAMLAMIAAAAPAARAQEIAVAPFTGKMGKNCSQQVADVVAEVATLVPWNPRHLGVTWAELSTALKEHGHEAGVTVVILGSAGKANMVLEAYDLARVKLIGLRSIATGKHCRLAPDQSDLVKSFVEEALGIEHKDESPPLALLAPEQEHHTHEPTHEAEPVAPVTPLIGSAELLNAPKDPPTYDAKKRSRAPDSSLLAKKAIRASAELELALITRELSFSEVRTSNLRGYGVAMPVPGLSISAHPLLAAGDPGWLAPLFVEARYRRAIGVQSSRTEGGPEYDTSYSELVARAGWRLVIPSLGVEVLPAIGYHRTSFSLAPTRAGERELDLPRVAYSSLELRAAAEMPLFDVLTIDAAVSYLAVLSAGEVFSERFFSRGSAFGLELDAGARYALLPGLSAVAGVAMRLYSLSLDAEPTDTRVAGGASDTSFTFRTGIRAEM